MGIEPTTYSLRKSYSTPELRRPMVFLGPTLALILRGRLTPILERDTRIELALQPWEGRVLPLY